MCSGSWQDRTTVEVLEEARNKIGNSGWRVATWNWDPGMDALAWMQSMWQIAISIPSGGPRSPVTLLSCQLLESALWIWGRPRRWKPFYYKHETRGHRGAFVPQKALQGPAWFQNKFNFILKSFNQILFGNFKQIQYIIFSWILIIYFLLTVQCKAKAMVFSPSPSRFLAIPCSLLVNGGLYYFPWLPWSDMVEGHWFPLVVRWKLDWPILLPTLP